MKKGLIIFVRNPEPGKVKTRLASQISDEMALKVYMKLLEHTHKIASGVDADVHVFATEPLADARWKVFENELQIEGDLGEKMSHAFSVLFQRGYQKVVIIGSDCMELTTTHVEEAFDELEKNDIVIGPAADGGYYLLGMKSLHKSLFHDKGWSTSHILTSTMEEIDIIDLSCHQLQVLSDVDEEKDLSEKMRREIFS